MLVILRMNDTGLPSVKLVCSLETVTAISESWQGAPETAEVLGEGLAEAVGEDVARVGSGVGLVLAVGVLPPGEMSHHSSSNTTSTPMITTIRRRQ